MLDWFKEQQVPEAEFELVLGSDILFFRGCVTPVAAAIQRALRPGGFALISDPCRASVEDFCEKLAGHGLRVRLRYFDQARLAALPANEAAAAHDGFVQHWGQQRGRLIWAEKAGASVGGLREAGGWHGWQRVGGRLDGLARGTPRVCGGWVRDSWGLFRKLMNRGNPTQWSLAIPKL